MKWRKWNNILHRDIGYLVFGLTIIYGVSGIAVNHMRDWNPNFSKEREFLSIAPIGPADRDSLIAAAREALELTENPLNVFRPDDETLQLFYDGLTYSVDLPTGTVMVDYIARRPVLYEFNQLHLNTPKRTWTYVADIYALGLIVVAITGLFVLKGPAGLKGRGWWLTTIGIIIPAIYWILYLIGD